MKRLQVSLAVLLCTPGCSGCSEVMIDGGTGGGGGASSSEVGGNRATSTGASMSGGSGGAGGGALLRDPVVVSASLDGSVRVSCDDGVSWGQPLALRDGHPPEDLGETFPWVGGLSYDGRGTWVVRYRRWSEELDTAPSSPNWVRRSRDLLDWDAPTRIADGVLVDLARGSDHFFIAAEDAGQILRSSDGATWSALSLPMDEVAALRSVPETGRIVLVGIASGVGTILVSDDDAESFRPPIALPAACAITASSLVSEGSSAMLVVTGSSSCVTNDGGEHWIVGGVTPTFSSTVTRFGGQFIGYAEVDPYTSPDGLAWSKRESNILPVSPTGVGVSDTGTFVAMDFDTFHAMRSTDGLMWTVFDFDIGHVAFTRFGEAPEGTACAGGSIRE